MSTYLIHPNLCLKTERHGANKTISGSEPFTAFASLPKFASWPNEMYCTSIHPSTCTFDQSHFASFSSRFILTRQTTTTVLFSQAKVNTDVVLCETIICTTDGDHWVTITTWPREHHDQHSRWYFAGIDESAKRNRSSWWCFLFHVSCRIAWWDWKLEGESKIKRKVRCGMFSWRVMVGSGVSTWKSGCLVVLLENWDCRGPRSWFTLLTYLGRYVHVTNWGVGMHVHTRVRYPTASIHDGGETQHSYLTGLGRLMTGYSLDLGSWD